MQILVFFLILFLAQAAWAGPQVMSWDQVATATSYSIEQSVDAGATWTPVTPTVAPVCGGTPARCTATVNSPATGTVLYRFAASNAIGKTTRFGAGTWVCESCAPPPTAANVGVQ